MTASLHITTVDAAGSPLAGITLLLRSAHGSWSETTSAEGTYEFGPLDLGEYRVTAFASPAVHEARTITLHEAKEHRVRMVLKANEPSGQVQ